MKLHSRSVQFSSVLYFSNRYYLQNWTCPQVADANLGGSFGGILLVSSGKMDCIQDQLGSI